MEAIQQCSERQGSAIAKRSTGDTVPKLLIAARPLAFAQPAPAATSCHGCLASLWQQLGLWADQQIGGVPTTG